jgi:rubrerythrin
MNLAIPLRILPHSQKVMSEMVTKLTQGNALQEAAQIVQQYEGRHSHVQHWTCEVCGMVQSGSAPTPCDSCGVTDAFSLQQDMRNEIGSRW